MTAKTNTTHFSHETMYSIFTIDNLYTDEELNTFIDYVRNSSDKNRSFTNSPFKNGKMIEPDMSRLMFEKIKPNLPQKYVDTKGVEWTFKNSVKYVFYSDIKEGQMFGIHTDTGSEYNDTNNLFSKFTVLTYLNDDYEGGCTTFFTDDFIQTSVIKPQRGKTLIFDIDLYHKGEKVIKGTKYWIGTELVCSKVNNIIPHHNNAINDPHYNIKI